MFTIQNKTSAVTYETTKVNRVLEKFRELMDAENHEAAEELLKNLSTTLYYTPSIKVREEACHCATDELRDRVRALAEERYREDPNGFPSYFGALLEKDEEARAKMDEYRTEALVPSSEIRPMIESLHTCETDSAVRSTVEAVVIYLETHPTIRRSGYVYLHRVLEEAVILAYFNRIMSVGGDWREIYLTSLYTAMEGADSPYAIDLLTYKDGCFRLASWENIADETDADSLKRLLRTFMDAALRTPARNTQVLVSEFTTGVAGSLRGWIAESGVALAEETRFILGCIDDLTSGRFACSCHEFGGEGNFENPLIPASYAVSVVASMATCWNIDDLLDSWYGVELRAGEALPYLEMIAANALNVFVHRVVADAYTRGCIFPENVERILEAFFRLTLQGTGVGKVCRR